MPESNHHYRKINSPQKVLVVGSAIIDVIVTIPSIPQSGGDAFASSEEVIVGGCAYNVGNILQQLEATYDLMIPIGDGKNADKINRQLKQDGHQSVLNDVEGDNGWCLCMVEESGERTFLTVPGIEDNWKDTWFTSINFDEYDYIYLSGYSFEPSSSEVLINQLQHKHSESTIIFDPSPRVGELNQKHLKTLLQMGTILHCNEDELLTISGEADLKTGALKMHQLTNNPVIVTLGSKGTLFVERNTINLVEGNEVPLVDTIGAGDTHIGATIAALLNNESIEMACKWGNDAAAKTVQIQGGDVDLFSM